MSTNHRSPSLFERWLIGFVGAALLAVTIIWMVKNHFIQLLLIVGAIGLAIELVFLVAIWRRGIRWLFSRRGLVFSGWVAASLLSVIVLFYAEENWRGKRAWAALVRETTARGEKLDLASVSPRGSEHSISTNDFSVLLGAHRFYRPAAGWARGESTNFRKWTDYLQNPSQEGKSERDQREALSEPDSQVAAAELLTRLQPYAPTIKALQQVGEGPGGRFALDYEQGLFGLKGPFLPYHTLEVGAQVLCLRASANLALGRAEESLPDVLLASRLAQCLKQEPYWMAHALRAAMLMRSLQPIWEGFARRAWTEPQLAALQDQLEQMELAADLRRGLRGETLMMMNLADQFLAYKQGRPSKLGEQLDRLDGSERFVASLASTLYPSGWLYQDKVWAYRFYEEQITMLGQPTPRWPTRGEWEARLRKVTDPMLLIYVFPRLREMFDEGAETHFYLHVSLLQAQVACALERYRLAHGEYPSGLAELVPGFIPRLPVDTFSTSGASFGYRVEKDGFILYSPGANHTNDGGQPSPPIRDWRGGYELFPKLSEGDWVWSSWKQGGAAEGARTPNAG